MKVLILTNNMRPDSGWGRYSLSVIEGMRRLEVNLKVAVEENTGGEGCLPLLTSASAKGLFLNIFRVRRYARDYDIVHAFDGWPYGFLGYIAVLGTRKRLFINAVGTYSIAPLLDPIKGLLLKLAYRRSEKVFAISVYVKERLEKLTGLKTVEVVHLGTDIIPRLSSEEQEYFRKEKNLIGRNPILVTVGQIKDRKGQFDTVKAAEILKKTYPELLYVIIGSGDDVSYVEKIRKYVAEHGLSRAVRIVTDAKDDRVLAGYYSACDLFMLNSKNDGRHFEGFGLVILEANQFGASAIGSRGCGIEDAIKDGVNGFLAEPGDPADIAEKALMALLSRKIRPEDAVAWSRKFTWDATVDRYLLAYHF